MPLTGYDSNASFSSAVISKDLSVQGSITGSGNVKFNNNVLILGDLTATTFTASLAVEMSGATTYDEPGGSGEMTVGWTGGDAQVSVTTDNNLVLKAKNVEAMRLAASAVTASADFKVIKNLNVQGCMTSSQGYRSLSDIKCDGTIYTGFFNASVKTNTVSLTASLDTLIGRNTFIQNSTVIPAASLTGISVFAFNGGLWCVGSSGTLTQLASA
jgi:hypothetical protein